MDILSAFNEQGVTATMARVHEPITIAASAPRVWDVIGDFNALPKWHPAFARSEEERQGDHTIRRLVLTNGATLVERLEEKNDAERYYSYTILEGPVPVRNYRSTIHVRPAADAASSTIEWYGTFEAADGVPETDAERLIRDIYRAGLDNLRKKLRD
jgi:hypothetical protein